MANDHQLRAVTEELQTWFDHRGINLSVGYIYCPMAGEDAIFVEGDQISQFPVWASEAGRELNVANCIKGIVETCLPFAGLLAIIQPESMGMLAAEPTLPSIAELNRGE